VFGYPDLVARPDVRCEGVRPSHSVSPCQFFPAPGAGRVAHLGDRLPINSFATLLAPGFEAHLVPRILLPGLAELLVSLWLVISA